MWSRGRKPAFAAQRGALVNGLDAAEALLAIARLRVPDGDFRVGDLEILPYAASTFDAVLAADVLPYTMRVGRSSSASWRASAGAGHPWW